MDVPSDGLAAPVNHAGGRARRTMRYCLPALLLLGAPDLSMIPTVGGDALAFGACVSVSYGGSNLLLMCPALKKCRWNGANLLCSNIGRFRAYCATHPGIPPCAPFARQSGSGAGGGSGGDGGEGAAGSSGESVSPPTPGANIEDDVHLVKVCLDRTQGRGPPHLLAQVASWGRVRVSYGEAILAIPESPTTTRMVQVFGLTEWNGGSPRTTIDHENDCLPSGQGQGELLAPLR